MLLDRYSTEQLCYLLNEIDGHDLNRQKEILTQWFIRNGGNQSETEELIYRQAEFTQLLADWRAQQSAAWEAKLESDLKRKEQLKKQKLWDDEHNCEIPVLNSSDPRDYRFGGTGIDLARSPDVDWRSNS